MPLVSVIMVAHRDTPFLRSAIRSVLEQTMSDLELILIDNGSGISPVDLGDLGQDPRLRWVPLDGNRGLPLGHNIGMSLVRGEFVAILDSDDIALPERFAAQVKALRKNPHLALVYAVARVIDEEGRVTGRQFTLISERDHRVFSQFDMPTATPMLMGRREILLRYPYREYFKGSPDFDMLSRVLDAEPVRTLPAILGEYRCHGGQTTVQHRGMQILDACIVRLITARRRAGRPEALEQLATELQACKVSPPDLATQYTFFARRCLRENFPLLAVYFARKVLSDKCGPWRILFSLSVLARASVQDPIQVVRLTRMFFTGPLRTFGLEPA